VEQIDLLRFAIEALERLGIRYALVGSYASGVWGETRFTQDIDLLLELGVANVVQLCNAFPAEEFYVSQSAAQEAVARCGQFNVIHPASGNKIDFMVAGKTAWSTAQLERRKRVVLFKEQEVDVAAPEDVIIGKLVYYREGGSVKHLRDITGILKISGAAVDREYITQFARQLGLSDIWQQVRESVE
jgi:hypothetical protein